MKATAVAHPNIALVKYWGKRDDALNLPAVPSLSLTLGGFVTTTTVTWGAATDRFRLDGREADADEARKVFALLDRIDPSRPRCDVESQNDFPTAAGLASSSSGFAALAVASAAAAGVDLDPTALSVLARQGSGSACRSLWGGFVEWRLGERADGLDSHGLPVAGPEHWDVALVVAVVSASKKAVGSRDAMRRTRDTSALFHTFVAEAPGRVTRARQAVLRRDLRAVGVEMEASTYLMHATGWAAEPPVFYWAPASLVALQAVAALRARGVATYATLDAGPNVKALCAASDADVVRAALIDALRDAGVDEPRVVVLRPGPGARVVA